MIEEKILVVLAYIIPIYVANASALLFGGGKPLDFNKKFMGKPILGKGKTFRGTFAGIFFGIVCSLLLTPFFPKNLIENYAIFGTFASLGAILGDITASFIKRRIGLERGQQAPLLDQLDFVFGSFLFTCWLRMPTIDEIVTIALITLIAHRIANIIAFKLKIKEVPW